MRLLKTLLWLLVAVLASLPSRADAQANSPILLWGFQRGCKQLQDVTREVQQHLEATVTKPVDYLVPDSKLLGCQGSGCAAVVQRACSGSQRRIIGGQVDQNAAKTLVRVRLWLYDPQTGQTAYHDNYCQNCDITKALKINAAEIAQNPNFTSPPGSTPIFCQGEAPTAEPAQRSNKIYWVVYGKDPSKAAITSAMRGLVQQTAVEVPFQHEGKEYTTPVLKKIIGKEPGAQVFGVEIQSNGVVELFLYDGPTELIEIQRVECPTCDKDSLLEKVKQTAANVLSHCFGSSCAHVGRSRAPAEACRPFESLRCGDEPLPLALTDAATDKPSGPEISPRLAKITKGALWGVFAASAAMTVALLAANYSGVGELQAGPGTIHNTLLPATAATGIIALISLGVAIPATIVINRAAKPPQGSSTSTPETTGAPSIQCPN